MPSDPSPVAEPVRPPHVIDPNAVYTVPSAAAALGLKPECLPREIRLGRLQARKRAGRYFILGAWLLSWLATGESHRRWAERAEANHDPGQNGARKNAGRRS